MDQTDKSQLEKHRWAFPKWKGGEMFIGKGVEAIVAYSNALLEFPTL